MRASNRGQAHGAAALPCFLDAGFAQVIELGELFEGPARWPAVSALDVVQRGYPDADLCGRLTSTPATQRAKVGQAQVVVAQVGQLDRWSIQLTGERDEVAAGRCASATLPGTHDPIRHSDEYGDLGLGQAGPFPGSSGSGATERPHTAAHRPPIPSAA